MRGHDCVHIPRVEGAKRGRVLRVEFKILSSQTVHQMHVNRFLHTSSSVSICQPTAAYKNVDGHDAEY